MAKDGEFFEPLVEGAIDWRIALAITAWTSTGERELSFMLHLAILGIAENIAQRADDPGHYGVANTAINRLAWAARSAKSLR
jgi:hypothetical protein